MEKQEKEDRKNVGSGGKREKYVDILYIYIYINMVTRTYWVVHDTHHVMRSNKETRKKKGKKKEQEPSPLFVVRVGSTGGPSDAIYMAAPQRKTLTLGFRF